MTVEDAKVLLVEMAKQLAQSKLSIGTWGDISTRIDSNLFAMNPAGHFYESLKPEDVSILKIKKDTLDKNKRSFKQSFYSKIYNLDGSVNFIVYTHQKFATALAGFSKKIPVKEEKYKELLGDFIPAIGYTLYGTKEFTQKVVACLKENSPKAILLSNNGILCFGATMDEILLRLETLEEFCREFIFNLNYKLAFEHYRYDKGTSRPLFNFYASKRVGEFCFIYHYISNMIICKMDIKTGTLVEGDFDFPADLHRKIYAERDDINFIEQCVLPASLYVSKKIKTKKEMPAFFEDFAKKAGNNIIFSSFFENNADKLTTEIVSLLKDRNAIVIAESGILCCTNDINKMNSLKEIVEKNSLALIVSLKSQDYQPLHPRLAKKLRKKEHKKHERNR